MSANITIKEGGVGRQFTSNKLKTNLVGGGACLWVPQNEVQLGTKNITKNGTYKAKDDEYYGYSQVAVNVQYGDTITGKDPVTGQETVVGTDPTTGEIVQTVVPTEIRVISPPTNPYGIYKNGQTITKDGLVVKAYLENGDEWGSVPNAEVTIAPTTAVYDPETDTYGEYNQLVTPPDGMIPGNVQIRVLNGSSFTAERQQPGGIDIEHLTFNQSVSMCRPKNSVVVLAGKSSPIIGETYVSYYSGGESSHYVNNYTDTYTYDGKTVIYGQQNLYTDFMPAQDDLQTYEFNKLAWAMIYGTIEEVRAGSRQQITVSWPRPGDSKILETTFEILVAPPIYGDSDN